MNLATLLPLVVQADGADNVRPGWIPFFIVLAIGAFIAFLYFSMKKQLGRIDFEEKPKTRKGDGSNGSAPNA